MLVPEFILLKSLVEEGGSKKFANTDRATVIYQRYFSGLDSSVSLAAFISELANIENLSWADHPSYRDLSVLLSNDPVTKDKISTHLQPHIDRFLKIRARADAVVSLEPGNTLCDVKGCSKRYQVTPEKKFLEGGLPIICSGCGTLLVPADLLAGFKEQGNV